MQNVQKNIVTEQLTLGDTEWCIDQLVAHPTKPLRYMSKVLRMRMFHKGYVFNDIQWQLQFRNMVDTVRLCESLKEEAIENAKLH
jgi:hypothetical protein